MSSAEKCFTNSLIASVLFEEILSRGEHHWMAVMAVNKCLRDAGLRYFRRRITNIQISHPVSENKEKETIIGETIQFTTSRPEIIQMFINFGITPVSLKVLSDLTGDVINTLKKLRPFNSVTLPSHSLCTEMPLHFVDEETKHIHNLSPGTLFSLISNQHHQKSSLNFDSISMDIHIVLQTIGIIQGSKTDCFDFEVEEEFEKGLESCHSTTKNLLIYGVEQHPIKRSRLAAIVKGLGVRHLRLCPYVRSESDDRGPIWDLAFATKEAHLEGATEYWNTDNDNSHLIAVDSLQLVASAPLLTEDSLILMLPKLNKWFETKETIEIVYKGRESIEDCLARLCSLPRVFLRQFYRNSATVRVSATLPEKSQGQDALVDRFESELSRAFLRSLQMAFLSFGYQRARIQTSENKRELSIEMDGFGKKINILVELHDAHVVAQDEEELVD